MKELLIFISCCCLESDIVSGVLSVLSLVLGVLSIILAIKYKKEGDNAQERVQQICDLIKEMTVEGLVKNELLKPSSSKFDLSQSSLNEDIFIYACSCCERENKVLDISILGELNDIQEILNKLAVNDKELKIVLWPVDKMLTKFRVRKFDKNFYSFLTNREMIECKYKIRNNGSELESLKFKLKMVDCLR